MKFQKCREWYGRHRKWLNMLFLGLILAFSFLCIYRVVKTSVLDKSYASSASLHEETVVALGDGGVITQSFAANDALQTVAVVPKKTDGDSLINGELTLELLDENGECVRTGILQGEQLAGDQLVFTFSEYVLGARGHTYTLKLTASLPEGALQLAASTYNVYDGGRMSVDGEEAAGDLEFIVYSPAYAFVTRLFIAVSVILIAGVLLVYWLAVIKRVKLQYVFVASVILLGFALGGIISPFKVPDEQGHYETAYRYSNMMLGVDGYRTESGGLLMRACDTARSPLFLKSKASPYYAISTVSSWAATVNDIFAKAGDETLVEVYGSSIGNIGQYLPSALGISLGRLLHLGMVPTFTLGRLFNFAVFVILTAVAIKLMPFGQTILFSVSMLAMTLQQAMSFSYDCLINGLAFLFIALVLHTAYDAHSKLWACLLGLCVCGGWLMTAKAGIYILLCALALLLLRRRSISLKKRWLCILAVAAAAVVSLIVFNLPNILKTVTNQRSEAAVSSQYAFSYILTHPKEFIMMILRTFYQRKSYYFSTMLGGSLCWLNLPMEFIYLALSVIFLLLSATMREGETLTLRKRDKVLFLSIVGFSLLFLFAVALTWTPLGSSTIEGIQGRYFLPLLPLLLLVLRTPKIQMHPGFERTLCVAQVTVSIFAFTNLMFTILSY